jgi:hypothetical protein
MRKALADGDDITVMGATKTLKQHFALRLDNSRWRLNDATLVPSAGACDKCPRNTANDRGLFDDLDDAALCMDATCFQSKVLALNEREKAKARGKGLVVFEGDEARAMLKFGQSSDELNGDYIYMDRSLSPLTGSDKTLAKLLGTLLKPSALFEHPKDLTLREVVLFTKAVDALRKHDLLMNDPDAGKSKAKPKAEPKSSTTVATPRDTSHMAPSGDLSGDDDDHSDDQAANDEGVPWPFEVAAAADTSADLELTRAWRLETIAAYHGHVMDLGYLDKPEVPLRLAVHELGNALLDGDAEARALIAKLWGVDTPRTASTASMLLSLTRDMNAMQLQILLAELLMVADMHDAEPTHMSISVAEEPTAFLCECEELEWEPIFERVTSATYPTMTPPPAGESHGAADQGGDVPSPPEGNEQQAGAASLKVTKDQRHWTGQMVKRKRDKRLGEVVDIEARAP